MIEALIVAVVYCLIVLLVAWVLAAIVGMLPTPAPIRGMLPTVIWMIAAIICLVILLRVLFGIAVP